MLFSFFFFIDESGVHISARLEKKRKRENELKSFLCHEIVFQSNREKSSVRSLRTLTNRGTPFNQLHSFFVFRFVPISLFVFLDKVIFYGDDKLVKLQCQESALRECNRGPQFTGEKIHEFCRARYCVP